MIHLYAVADEPAAPAAPAGIDGAAVRDVEVDGLVAVVSAHDRAPRPAPGPALAHAEVTLAVCRRGRATPVRFGAHHADEAALREAVTGRAEALRESLRRVGGHLEVLLRLASPPEVEPVPPVPVEASAVAEPGAGRAYLEDRLAASRAAAAASRAAAEALGARTDRLVALAADVVDREGRRGPERCLLVAHDRVETLLTAAHGLAAEAPELVVGGPWPPYTFA